MHLGVRLRASLIDNTSPINFGGTFTFTGGTAPELDANHQPVLDPSGQVLKPIPVGGEPSAIAVGGNAIWVAPRADGTVSRIDPRTATVDKTVRVGNEPEDIAVGRG